MSEVEHAQDGTSSPDKLDLEERLSRLERIVRSLEGEDVPLGTALALFEEGVKHLRAAETLLEQAELRVEELLGTGPDAVTRPLDGDS